MLRLKEEKDPEILRQAALLLEAENGRLIQKNIALTKKLLELQGADKGQLELKLAQLEEQLAQARQRLYGESSEKRPRPEGAAAVAEERRPQRGHGPRAQPELPVVEQLHTLEEPDKTCPSCGGQLAAWEGQVEQSEEVDVVERRFVLVKHRRQKYRCRCQGCVETAAAPPKLQEGSRYSVGFAIEVATGKYLDHLPLERQVRIMAREGLAVDSQTLWDQIDALAKKLAPAHAALHRYVLGHDVIGADETRWRLMGAKGDEAKRWQAWAVVAADAVCYRIHDNRSMEAAKEVLGDYRGVVMADGYGAYDGLAKRGGGFTVAHCWAHVRRKFVEAEDFFPGPCGEALALIGELYLVEKLCPTGPPGDDLRRRLRDERSRDIVRRLQAWSVEARALPESALGKAIAYMGGLWKGLTRFLDDPRIPLDNNATERALRGVVVGRKNHYGSRSRRGTEVAALFYSLLESAKLTGLDPKQYLRQATLAALRGEAAPLPHELAAKQ
ncbi:MAG: IS66 family transposase [Acidobacteriota bacterium]|nr:IS66 family transposase [Acidobacteriota bacterium]